jgi:hypothetical protein
LLFTSYTAPAALILRVSVPLFGNFCRDEKEEKREANIVQAFTLFVFSCAPTCAAVSSAITVAYFAYKQKQYGA